MERRTFIRITSLGSLSIIFKVDENLIVQEK